MGVSFQSSVQLLGLTKGMWGQVVMSPIWCDLCDMLLGAWQEVKGEAMSVNEADYSWYTTERPVVGVVVRRWSCPAHTGNR